MSTTDSDLDLVLARLADDPAFFEACQRATRGRQGDEAILRLMNFASESGYEVTFQEAKETRKRALTLQSERMRVLREALARERGRDVRLEDFFRQW